MELDAFELAITHSGWYNQDKLEGEMKQDPNFPLFSQSNIFFNYSSEKISEILSQNIPDEIIINDE